MSNKQSFDDRTDLRYDEFKDGFLRHDIGSVEDIIEYGSIIEHSHYCSLGDHDVECLDASCTYSGPEHCQPCIRDLRKEG